MFVLVCTFFWLGCNHPASPEHASLPNGFYEVLDTHTLVSSAPQSNEYRRVDVDPLFNPDLTEAVLLATADYVPLELKGPPLIAPQSDSKNLLSISLSQVAAGKMKEFTASRVMKQVALVIDGKVITFHKIREAISGEGLQITRCDDQACDYLFLKLKQR